MCRIIDPANRQTGTIKPLILMNPMTRGFDLSAESRTEKSRESVGKRAFVFLRSLI
jgi:hypothetical protein